MSANAGPYSYVSFYFAAHPDDWQLFMGDKVCNDMSAISDKKVVILHITSGDATYDGVNLNIAYYQSREKGAQNSIEFCGDMQTNHDVGKYDKKNIAGHLIRRYTYKNTVAYFFRLPDGCFKTGFNNESIQYLNENKISKIRAVDSSATYLGWDDLVNTVKTVILEESASIPEVWVNTNDPENSFNPGDHPDHVYSGLLAKEAVAELDYINRNGFQGYNISNLPENLTTQDIILKTGAFASADFGLTQSNTSSNFEKGHWSFIPRTYYRTYISKADSFMNHVATISSGGVTGNYCVIYPVPAADVININYYMLAHGRTIIKLLDASGAILKTYVDDVENQGAYTRVENVNSLHPGVYFLSITTSLYSNNLKFIKE